MKETRIIMGMPVTVEIADASATLDVLDAVFEYFTYVDEKFSTYKHSSEISRISRGELAPLQYSDDMKFIFKAAQETKNLTNGYFDIKTPEGLIDPSGIVKGWAIRDAAQLLRARGYENFYVEIGGDIQTSGTNSGGGEWRIGIRNPFNRDEVIKIVHPQGCGIATSGTAARGAHIWDPHTQAPVETNFASFTVIGPDVYEADRFATAAFAMGKRGLEFIENLVGFEAYAVDSGGIATMTSGFEKYTYDQND